MSVKQLLNRERSLWGGPKMGTLTAETGTKQAGGQTLTNWSKSNLQDREEKNTCVHGLLRAKYTGRGGKFLDKGIKKQ